MSTRSLVRMAIIAALYTTFTLVLAPISYGPFQFRAACLLYGLALLSPDFAIGLALGVFFANIASPFGAIDFLVMPLVNLGLGLLSWRMRKYPYVAMIIYGLGTGAAVSVFPLYLGGGVPIMATLPWLIIAQLVATVGGWFFIWRHPYINQLIGDEPKVQSAPAA